MAVAKSPLLPAAEGVDAGGTPFSRVRFRMSREQQFGQDFSAKRTDGLCCPLREHTRSVLDPVRYGVQDKNLSLDS